MDRRYFEFVHNDRHMAEAFVRSIDRPLVYNVSESRMKHIKSYILFIEIDHFQ